MLQHNAKINTARAVRLYKAGNNISTIAIAFGFPRGTGNNRVRAVLEKAGVHCPKNPDALIRECLATIEKTYQQLRGRARSGWKKKLATLLLRHN